MDCVAGCRRLGEEGIAQGRADMWCQALHDILDETDGREDIDNNGGPNLAMRIAQIARAALAGGKTEQNAAPQAATAQREAGEVSPVISAPAAAAPSPALPDEPEWVAEHFSKRVFGKIENYGPFTNLDWQAWIEFHRHYHALRLAAESLREHSGILVTLLAVAENRAEQWQARCAELERENAALRTELSYYAIMVHPMPRG